MWFSQNAFFFFSFQIYLFCRVVAPLFVFHNVRGSKTIIVWGSNQYVKLMYGDTNSRWSTTPRSNVNRHFHIMFQYGDQSSVHLENYFWDEIKPWNMLSIIINSNHSWLLTAIRSLFYVSFPFCHHLNYTSKKSCSLHSY